MYLTKLNINHRKMDKSKILPSETIQKQYEENPLKILESIRNEKENENSQKEIQENKIAQSKNVNNKIKDERNISPNNDKKKLEELKQNDIFTSFDINNINKQNIEDVNRTKINNQNYINNINNINNSNNINCNNTFINYNTKYNFNKNNNIIVNHLNIFFNFNSENNKYNTSNIGINKNINNNNNVVCDNNKNIKVNSNENCNDNKIIKDLKCINNNYKSFCKDSNKNEMNNNNSANQNSNKSNENNDNNFNNILLNKTNKLMNDLKTYKGSIVSQAYIDTINDQKELSIFFQKLLPHICQIMCSDYGNYFFQKLIKKLNIQQRLNIFQAIEHEFLVIATNKCGTHSIQSLIDVMESPYEYLALNKLISQNMLLLFTDDNGYHIMMKIILEFPEEKRLILNIYLIMNIEKIIINCNGAFCVNKFITNNKNLNLRKLFIDNLSNNIKKIIFNKFSCINLLLVLQTFGVEWGGFIIKEIEENFVVMSENPVSNVFIYKVLEYLNNNNILILKLLIWSLYKNLVLLNYLLINKNHKKLLKQIIEYSDNDQKQYLFVLLKQSKW